MTDWLTPVDAHSAYQKTVNLRGRKACAVEVRSGGRDRPKQMRLLFTAPTDREPYGSYRFDAQHALPAYVSDQ